MKLRDPKLWLSAFSLLAVFAIAYVDLERTSPGEITRTHAQEGALLSTAGCAECHGASGQEMALACLTCHEDVGEQLEQAGGFHGTMAEVDARACDLCHLEHHGSDFALVSALSFAIAGVADRDEYGHDGLGFELAGKHEELDCSECHELADDDFLMKGQKRFLGLDHECVACHEDPHEGRMADGCAECHGQERPFPEAADFAHSPEFPLEGAHARLACADCHAEGGTHAIEVLAGRGARPESRACSACHDSPHTNRFLAKVAATLDSEPAASCARCHEAVHGGFAGESATLERDLHRLTGFPLEPPHDDVVCAGCHGAASSEVGFADRFPGRRTNECAVCHTDPHAGQFEVGPFADESCLGCHDRLAFVPPAFGVVEHARTAFALTGRHAAVACAACHSDEIPDQPGSRRFQGTSAGCADCHTDPHAGQFEIGPFADEGCLACHDTSSFSPPAFDIADHARTAFPLGESHEAVPCAACHSDEVDGHPGSRRFRGTSTRCAACHVDAHDDAWASLSVEDATSAKDCRECHLETRFADVDRTAFDHGRWTSFPLDEAHAAASCESCHRQSVRADEVGRTFGRVTDIFGSPATACSTCHADTHAGAFDGIPDPHGASGCVRCHGTGSFRALEQDPFDHRYWTGYALAGSHASASCEACHPRQPEPDALGRTFGRARGRSCASCHANPHAGQFSIDGRTDCARCHTSLESFRLPDLDHDRDTRFALDENHVELACAACHKPWPLPGGASAVRYKPLGTDCVSCHGTGDPRGREDR